MRIKNMTRGSSGLGSGLSVAHTSSSLDPNTADETLLFLVPFPVDCTLVKVVLVEIEIADDDEDDDVFVVLAINIVLAAADAATATENSLPPPR